MNTKITMYEVAIALIVLGSFKANCLHAQSTFVSDAPKFHLLMREPNLVTVRSKLPLLLEKHKLMFGNDTLYEAYAGIWEFAEHATTDDWRIANEIALTNDQLSALGAERRNVKRVNRSFANIERAEKLFGPSSLAVLYMKYMVAGQCVRLESLGFKKHHDAAKRYLNDVLASDQHVHTMINLLARYLLSRVAVAESNFPLAKTTLEEVITDWELRKLPGLYGVSLAVRTLLAETLIELQDYSAANRVLSSIDSLEKLAIGKEGRENYWIELVRRDIAYAKIRLSAEDSGTSVFLLRKCAKTVTERDSDDLIAKVEMIECLIAVFNRLGLDGDASILLTEKEKLLMKFDLSE